MSASKYLRVADLEDIKFAVTFEKMPDTVHVRIANTQISLRIGAVWS